MGAFWGPKAVKNLNRFSVVLFLRLASAAPLRRDFGGGAYGPDAPQAAPLSREKGDITTPGTLYTGSDTPWAVGPANLIILKEKLVF